jgi:tetratricopeptide (TPR) repeat protein
MTRRLIFASAIVLVPALFLVWWWYYGPSYQQSRLLADAEKAVQAEEFSKAEELLRRLLKDDPNQARPQLLYAQVLRRMGRPKEAELPWQRAYQLGVPEADALREYALIESRVDFVLAEGYLLKVFDANPDDLEVIQTLAVSYARSNRWTEAEKFYTRWLALEPDRTEAQLDRGKVYMNSGSLGAAMKDFREVLRRSPNHFPARLLLAQCLLSEARIDEAEKELLLCRKLRPASPEPIVGLASCAMEKADPNKALRLVKEALALEPDSPLALHLLGYLYMRQKQFDLAIGVFEQILRKNESDKEGHLKLAQALSQSGKLERAKKHQEIFTRLDREDEIRKRKERGIRTPGTK